MNNSPLLLIGVGGAGCTIACNIKADFGDSLRLLLTDTDAGTINANTEEFALLGGERLSGRGSGGDLMLAKTAAAESLNKLTEKFAGVRLAVIVAGIGGGTGAGSTLAIVEHLQNIGIPTIVFAVKPFAFEGEARHHNARSVENLIEEAAACSFFLPLDALSIGNDNLNLAMSIAADSLAAAITLFWRILEKPGYLHLDIERLRQLLGHANHGRFAIASAAGLNRAGDILEQLRQSPLLKGEIDEVKTIICGLLAGDDLRLSEIGEIADGVCDCFGSKRQLELATVNDEETFSGRIATVVMTIEDRAIASSKPNHRISPQRKLLTRAPNSRGRFKNAERTLWHNEDLDLPTYLRQKLTLEQ